MESKLFYRVGNTKTEQGLWYDFDGNFTGLIHDKFKFCKNHNLPMPFDEKLVGWLSATETLDELFLWVTQDDICKLEEFGFKVSVYEATEYKRHENHWIIKQDTSSLKEQVSLALV